jgi:hypothetical protein
MDKFVRFAWSLGVLAFLEEFVSAVNAEASKVALASSAAAEAAAAAFAATSALALALAAEASNFSTVAASVG